MKKITLCVIVIVGLLAFAGCNKNKNAQNSSLSGSSATTASGLTDAKPTPETVAVIVNGQPISRALLQAIMTEMAQSSGGQTIAEDKVIDGLIARELLRQEAEKQNLTKDPTVAMKMENAVRDVLIQAKVENFRKNTVITDEELKKEYDVRVTGVNSVEFKARHILVDNEDVAKDIIAKLQNGAKFDELAKNLSKDTSAKQNGGDLGWFNAQQMVPEFSAALATMKNGEISKAPIKSQYGWHVIQRQDSRKQTPPPFNAVKEQLRDALIGQKLQKHVDELKNSAKIERLTLKTAVAPLPPATNPAK
jgi:peptidyl-prolyl cis-trans isomerase C